MIELTYPNKKSINEVLVQTPKAQLGSIGEIPPNSNLLIKGDNLQVMQTLVEGFDMKNKIDLVYIDPPFSTNTIFRKGIERANTISSSAKDEIAYHDTLSGPEYLEYIRQRLIFLRELLSPEGSIYFHIDYKIGHYVKIIMDEIFGENHFQNDISRIKCNPKNFQRKAFGNIKDMVLFYTKTEKYIWHEPLTEKTLEINHRLFNKIDKNGRRYTTNPLHAPGETINGRTGKEWHGLLPPKGRHWRYDPSVLDELEAKGLIEWSSTGNPRKIIYEDENRKMRMQDIWEYKDSQTPSYPTEKNLEMLEMIISTSSNPNSIVMDCFCGSGTTLVASSKLGRNWIGIDKSSQAIKTTYGRIKDTLPLLNSFLYFEQVD